MTSSNKQQPIPKCVIDKTFLEQKDDYLFKCPKCKLEYTLFYEIMEYDDSVGTAYDDEAAIIETGGLEAATGPRLETKDNELDFLRLDEEMESRYREGQIPIPKYMQSGPGQTLVEFKETIIEDD